MAFGIETTGQNNSPGGGATSLTVSYTATAATLMLGQVGAGASAIGDRTVSTMAYNTVAMTIKGSADDTNFVRATIAVLDITGVTGAHNLVIGMGGTALIGGGATGFTVADVASFGVVATNHAADASGTVTATSATGEILVAVIATDADTSIAEGGGGTQLWKTNAIGADCCFGGEWYPGASSVTATYTLTGGTGWAMVAMSIKPAGGGGGGGASPTKPAVQGRSHRQRAHGRQSAPTHRHHHRIIQHVRGLPATYTVTMSGGVSTGGAGVVALKKVIVAAGGTASSGAGVVSERKVIVGAGGAQSGGVGVLVVKKVVIPAGGGTGGGHATNVIIYVPSSSGGLNAGGAGTTSFTPGAVARRGVITMAHRRARQHRAAPMPLVTHRIIYSPTFGSPPSFVIYSHTMTGGVQSGGACVAVQKKVIVAAGGAQTGGHSTALLKKVVVPSGGVITGGVATVQFTGVHTVVMSGGVQTGGTAPSCQRKVIVAVGGMVGGGHASSSVVRPCVGAGGAQTSGVAPMSIRYRVTPSGGLNSGGAAGIQFKGVFTVTMSGGVQAGGGAVIARRAVPPLPAGGVITSGTGAGHRLYLGATSGGVSTSGHGVARATRSVIGIGGVHVSGAAGAVYISGAAIPAAFSGRVVIVARFNGRITIDPE